MVQKGVSHAIIGELNENSEVDWYLQAKLAYNKRFGAKAISDTNDEVTRIRLMQYRGFSTDQIMTLANQ